MGERVIDEGAGAVLALVLAVPTAVGGAAVAAVAGASWWQCLAVALTVPSLSLPLLVLVLRWAGPGVVAGKKVLSRADPAQTAAPASLERHDALAMLQQAERGVFDLAGAALATDDERQLLDAALRLYEARLALARVHLREDGDVPDSLKDELVVQHRNLTRLLDRLEAG